jgi:hypothetical protein
LAAAEWREPASSDRLSVHRSESQPAIPRRVAPQQSPLPLHQSPTIVAQSRPARQSNASLNLTARMPPAFGCDACRAGHVRRQRGVISTLHAGCHFYLAPTNSVIAIRDDTPLQDRSDTPPGSGVPGGALWWRCWFNKNSASSLEIGDLAAGIEQVLVSTGPRRAQLLIGPTIGAGDPLYQPPRAVVSRKIATPSLGRRRAPSGSAPKASASRSSS